MRRKSIDHIKAVIELAVARGATDVVISPGARRHLISPALEMTYGWLLESLATVLPIVRRSGTELLMENTPYCFTPRIENRGEVVRTVGDDGLKNVYDVADIARASVAGVGDHADLIGLVRISDTGLETWGHDPIGTGVVVLAGSVWTIAEPAEEVRGRLRSHRTAPSPQVRAILDEDDVAGYGFCNRSQ